MSTSEHDKSPAKKILADRLANLDVEMLAENFNDGEFKVQTNKLNYDYSPNLLDYADKDRRPHLLMLDNDADFLKQIEFAWQERYPNSFTLHCAHLGTSIKNCADVIDYVISLKNKTCQQPFLFIDCHHDSFTIPDLLEKLYINELTRYIPIAFMTADLTGTLDNDHQFIAAKALRILYNKRGHPYFLYECASILDQLQSEVEERKWTDLRKELAKNIANNDLDTIGVLKKFQDFLAQQLDIKLAALRELQANGILKLYLPPISSRTSKDGYPDEIGIKKYPYYEDLIHSKDIVVRKDNLTKEETGNETCSPPVGDHLLAATLRYENEVFGTLVLFRNHNERPFRYQDEHRLLPAVMELSAYLGQRKNQDKLEQRQQDLLSFVEKVDASFNEKEILDSLAEHLHRIIHHNDNEQSKTTLRLLASGTGELISKVDLLGLHRDNENKKISIYSPCSTYATAVSEGETVFYDDINAHQESYCPTRQGLNACMTVPLLASGNLRLGAVNLEHTKKSFYTKGDKIYAESLCRIAANALLRLRASEFKLGLIQLIKELNKPLDSDITSTIYELLYNYFRYACLVELAPSESIDMPWRVEKVMRVDKNDNLYSVSSEEFKLWQDNIDNDWEKTFVKKVINQDVEERFTNSNFRPEMLELNITTESEAAIYLKHNHDLIPDRAIMLLFLVKSALNQEQIRLFKHFGNFLSTIFKYRDETMDYFIQAKTSELESLKGKAAQQMRHGLRNYLGSLTNCLDMFEISELSEISKNDYIKESRNTLVRLGRDMRTYRDLNKTTLEFNEVNISEIWIETKKSLEFHDFLVSHKVEIGELPEKIYWKTDKDYLKAVFDNLLQNSLESGELLTNVFITSRNEKNFFIISICNNGEKIPKESQKRLFTLGYTTKSMGSGFGLCYCRYIMQKMGGQVYYRYDEKNKHTCFELHFPDRSSK